MEGSPDLKTGQTFASFHFDGKIPDETDRLKIEHRGVDNSCESSLRTLLLIPSGPDAFDIDKFRRMGTISSGVKIIEERLDW